MTEKMNRAKNSVMSIFEVISKLPVDAAGFDPMTTGWMVRNSRMDMKEISTLIAPMNV